MRINLENECHVLVKSKRQHKFEDQIPKSLKQCENFTKTSIIYPEIEEENYSS